MSSKIKRFLAALLSAVMIVTMMPTVSLAASVGSGVSGNGDRNAGEIVGTQNEYYYYHYNNDYNNDKYLVLGGSAAPVTGTYYQINTISDNALIVYVDTNACILDSSGVFSGSQQLLSTNLTTASGKPIKRWTVNGVPGQTRFDLENDKIYIAVAELTAAVTVDAGTINGASSADIGAGETFTLAAPAAQAGKNFLGWFGSDGKVYRAGDYTLANTDDLTLTAVYDTDNNDNTQYSIVKYLDQNGGLFYADLVEKGAQHTVYDKYPSGAEQKWYSDKNCTTEVTGAQTINANTNYYAKAVTKNHTVSLSPYTQNPNASKLLYVGIPNTVSNGQSFRVGQTVSVKVQTVAGERLKSVYCKEIAGLDIKQSDADPNVYDFTMPDKDITICADFESTQIKVNIDGNMKNGTVTAAPNAAAAGETVTLTAEPDAKYELSAWYYMTAGGTKVDLDASKTSASFKMPDEDITVYATFTSKPGTVTSKINYVAQDEDGKQITVGGTITPTTATDGNNVDLSYTAPDGYTIVNVKAIGETSKTEYKLTEGASTDRTRQYTLTMPQENVTFLVTLKANTYTVYFRADGKLVDKLTVKYGETVAAPEIPEKEGYDPDEWVAVNGAKYDKAAKVTADITYNATYNAKEYKVSYIPAGIATDRKVSYGATFTAPQVDNVYYWKSSDGRIMEPGEDYKVTEDITLTAVQKEANKIVVTYKDMDGKIVDYQIVNEKTTFQTKDYPAQAGYTDLKWTWTQPNQGEVEVNGKINNGFENDTVLTLSGTPVALKITANNVTVDPTTAKAGDVVEATVSKTAKQEFVGISVVGNSGKAYTVDTISVGAKYSFVMPVEDVTVTATLKDIPADQFAVKFIADGSLVDIQSVAENAFADAPADPTKTGYTFKHWSLNGTDAVDVNATAITKDTTFYAVFEVNSAKLTFNSNGGSSVASIDTTYGATATLPDAPTKADSKFVGWQDDATGLVYSAGAKYSVTGNADFTAVWAAEKQYVVTFKDVTGALHGYFTVDKGATVTAPDAPTAPTGKTFQQWKSGTTVLTAGETSPAITADTEFTAQYADELYTLKVIGTDTDITTGTHTYNEVITLTPLAVSNNQKVKAVYISYNNGVNEQLYSTSGTYTFRMPAYPTTLYVIREDVMWNIRFNVDGALYQTASVKDGDQITAPTAPTKEGYTFKGWSENGTDVVTLPTATKNAEYEAVFEANKYDITVDKGSVDNATVAYGGKFTLTAPTGADAKDFIGWSGSDGKYYVAGTYKFTGTDNLKLTAVYSSNTEYYVVKYLYPDGSTYSFDVLEKTGNLNIQLPDYPSIEGSTATGWKIGNVTYQKGDPYTVSADTVVTLVATVNNYTIKVDDGSVTTAAGTGTSVTVAYDGTFTLKAPTDVPAGKTFLGWAGDNGDFYIADTDYTFKGTENLTLTAVYENDTKYQLAKFYAADGKTLLNVRLVQSGDDTVTVPGTADDEWTYINNNGDTVTVKGGSTVTVSEIKADSNGEFVFTAVAKTYKAYWKSVDANGVEITDSGATGTTPAPEVAEGKTATITYTGLNTDKYTLKSYYAVGNTTGQHYGVVANGNNEYVLKTMPNEDVTFYFVLAANQYTVTFKSESGKMLQTDAYALGDTVPVPRDTAIAEAKPGYTFKGWKSDVPGIPNIFEDVTSYKLGVAQNVTYTAYYEADNYAVTTSADAHSTITVTKPQNIGTVNAGDVINFTVEANDGYAISGVSVKETVSGKLVPFTYDGTKYEFTMPAANVTISSTSIVNKYTVTFVDDDNTLLGTVAVDHDAVVDPANAPTAAKAGYDFDKWVIIPDGTQQFRLGTDPVKSNLTVKATYIGYAHSVVKGNADNLKVLRAWETETSYGAAKNSADLLNTSGSTALNTNTGKLVYFEAEPATGYTIKNIYVTAQDGSQISVDVQRYKYDDAKDHYIMYFTMPDKDMQINVETEAKQFMVTVTNDPTNGGTHKINGYSTDNRKITVGENVTIPVTANEGYTIEKIETSYTDENGALITTLGTVNYNGGTAKVGDTLTDVTSATLNFTMVPYPVDVKITYKALTYNVDVEESNKLTYRPTIEAGGTTADAESLDPDYTVKGKIYLVDDQGNEIATQKRQVNTVAIDVPGDARYEVNKTVHFKVQTYTGYELDKLYATYANGTKTAVITPLDKNETYHLTMPADDVVITATFKEVTNDVIKTDKDEEHGKVVVSSSAHDANTFKDSNDKRTSVQYKNDVKVTVTPDAGYYVSKIAYALEDTNVVDFHNWGSTNKPEYTSDKAASSNYSDAQMQDDTAHDITFTMPAANVKLTVEYKPINYVISSEITDENGDPTTNATVDIQNMTDTNADLDKANVGDKIFVAVTPEDGYDVETVSVVNNVTGEIEVLGNDVTEDEKGGAYSFVMPSEDVTVYVDIKRHEFNVLYRDSAGDLMTELVKYKDNVTKADQLPKNAPDGQHFVGWTSDDTDPKVTNPSRTNADFTVVSDTVLTAVYENDKTNVNFAASVNGKVEYNTKPDGYQAYTENTKVFGDKIEFSAVPDAGYVVDSITVSTKNSEGEAYKVDYKDTVNDLTHNVEFTIPATYKENLDDVNSEDIDVTVTFKKAKYLLTDTTKTHHGDVAVNGEVTTQTQFGYNFDEEVTIAATPDAGYYVKSITATGTANGSNFKKSVDGTNPGVDGVGTTVTLTFNMPSENVDFKVVYEKIDYSITHVADPTEGGSVTTTPADTAQMGDVVQVHVAPATGYQLKKLTVTYASGEKSCALTQVGSNEYTFTMPAEGVTVTAEFETVSYYVTASINGNGKFTLNEDYTYMTQSRYLDTVTVNVMPDAGWRVQSVVANDGTVAVTDEGNGKYTFTMPHKNVNVVITLEKIPYTVDSFAVNYYEDGHGKVTADKTTANVGDKITITADPDEGYHVKDIKIVDKKGNSVPVSIVSEDKDYTKVYSFTMPAEAVDVTVAFSVNASSYYTDVRSDKWYNDAVEFVTDRGYFKGVSADKFGPMINMSRGMFVTVLGRIDADINGLNVDGYDIAKTSFTDVSASQYYAKYIAWAAENGIVTGRTASQFDPDGNVSREEMAAIMYRYCKYLGLDMSLQNQDFMNRYTDTGDIHNYAKTAVSWAVGTGLIQGVSGTSISPRTFATRAQVAQVIKNLSDKVLFNQG